MTDFLKIKKELLFSENDIPNLRTWWNDKKNNNNAFEVEIDKIQNEKYKLFLNFYKEYENIKYPKELSYICYDYILGMTPTLKNKSFYGDKYLWVKISDMKEKIILDTEEKLSQLGYDKLGENKYFNKGSLLFSFKLTIGKVSIAGEDLFTNEAICKLCLKDKYNNELVKDYLYYILPNINYKPFAQRAAKGYTLNKDILPTVVFPFSDSEYELEDIVNKYKLIENQILKLENDIADIKKEHSNLINSIIFEKINNKFLIYSLSIFDKTSSSSAVSGMTTFFLKQELNQTQ
ncbi:restriction endonuclease subunit S [Brachyspira hyodysenteriae]|nr:restriction endonuclease subunit S [Brachyspira hyodysenteriae]MDA0064138.1 restriction endonuclease subunit S [Brachyspira hyodysenteriae]